MKISTLRLLLADSKYDDINLNVAVDPEDVSEGCYMCVFNQRKDICLINSDSTVDMHNEYYEQCRL